MEVLKVVKEMVRTSVPEELLKVSPSFPGRVLWSSRDSCRLSPINLQEKSLRLLEIFDCPSNHSVFVSNITFVLYFLYYRFIIFRDKKNYFDSSSTLVSGNGGSPGIIKSKCVLVGQGETLSFKREH